MRPTSRFFLLALITFFLFGTVPAIQAQTAATAFSGSITGTAICADPPQSYSGNISQLGQIDYWEIKLAAGQKLVVDVDAETIGSSLDAYLEVLDKNGDTIGVNNDEADESGRIISLDPYLEVTAPSDDYYYIGISSAVTKPLDDPDEDSQIDPTTGPYTFFVQCSDQPAPSEFTWPVVVGDLLGATDSDSGSLINITPDTAVSTLPFDLGVGPIIDIEFDPSRELVLAAVDTVDAIDDAVAVDAAAAVDYVPARIVALDPNSGNEVASYSLGTELVVALEAAEEDLYGIQVDPGTENYRLVLVTFNDIDLTATLNHVFSFGKQQVPALAYHQSEKVMYVASGIDLLKIDMASPPVGVPEPVTLTGLSFVIASIDFSNEDVLYVVDVQGNLYEVTDLTTGAVTLINPINTSGGVSGLTFVIGAPPNVEPIKTICSSTPTTSLASASSGAAAPKLSRFRLKKNPLHRAIGLFTFEGMQGETITLNVELEATQSAETGAEESSASELQNVWLNHWQGKGRVFLGIRDSIPGLDFRERKKEQIPFSMSATLPESGTYYVMLIRPLLRFYQTDYCLTLKSDFLDSKAADTFDVVRPHDDSQGDSASTKTFTPRKGSSSVNSGL